MRPIFDQQQTSPAYLIFITFLVSEKQNRNQQISIYSSIDVIYVKCEYLMSLYRSPTSTANENGINYSHCDWVSFEKTKNMEGRIIMTKVMVTAHIYNKEQINICGPTIRR